MLHLDNQKFVDSFVERQESSDKELNCTPKKLLDLATDALSDTVPESSKKRYERTYFEFTNWLNSNGTSHISESTLLAYFEEASKRKAPTSLWSNYSMLKTTIRLNRNIDISKYPRLIAFLKAKSRGYKPKKAMIFREEELARFLNEAPDSQFLAMKVATIISLSGCLRMNELIHVLVEHITEKPDMYLFDIPKTKNLTKRSFPVLGNWFHSIKKYRVLRPESLPNGRFFVRYQNGKCTAQFIGENTLKAMPKQIAMYLQLPNPELYTGHSFRRSSASVAANNGADTAMLKRLGGWMSEKVANSYVEESINYKKKTSNLIMSSIVAVNNFDEQHIDPPVLENSTTNSPENVEVVYLDEQDIDPAIFENSSTNSTKRVKVVLSQQHMVQVDNKREIMMTSNSTPQSDEKNNVDVIKSFNFTNCQVTINFNK